MQRGKNHAFDYLGAIPHRPAPVDLPLPSTIYLKFVVSPGHDVDFAEVFVEGEMRQIQWTVRSEGHGRSPEHVAIVKHYRPLLRAWHHQCWVDTAKSQHSTSVLTAP